MAAHSQSFPEQWVRSLHRADPAVLDLYPCCPSQVFTHALTREAAPVGPLSKIETAEWSEWLDLHAPHKAVRANIRRMAEPGTLAVVTGQQAGLLGGPLYTLYKAAGAIRLARRIEEETRKPCIPIFWIASDDHDYAEIALTRWLGQDGRVHTFRVDEDPAEAGLPVSRRRLDQKTVEQLIEAFIDSTSTTLFSDDCTRFLKRIAALNDLTWESQFTACLLEWFGSHGLVPLAPRLPFIRRRAAGVMQREIENRGETSRLLMERGARIAERGGGAHIIHRNGDEANFFLEVDRVRCKVTWSGETAQCTHPVSGRALASFSLSRLLQRLETQPESFSPNAALRPVIQDAVLPTAAYLGGPSEAVYHAQIAPLYQHFDVFRPAFIPRPSALLIDAKAKRILERWHLNPREFLQQGTRSLETTAAWMADDKKTRVRTAERLAALRNEAGLLGELMADGTRDTALIRATERLRNTINKAEARIAGSLDAWLTRRDTEIRHELEALKVRFEPAGTPQERALGVLSPLLLHGGTGVPARLPDLLDPLDPETAILKLDRIPA